MQANLAKQKNYQDAHKMQVECQEMELNEREKYMQERQKKIIAAEAKLITKQQNEMNALKKKLEANLNERLKVRETEHNKLLKRYQNVKREIEKQHNIEKNKFDKSMQQYITVKAARPGTATARDMQASKMMTSRMQGTSRMPASKPSDGGSPIVVKKSRGGVDWSAIAAKLPTSKTDPAQIKRRAELWKGFDNNGNGYASLAETEKGVRDALKIDAIFEAKPAIMRAFQFARNASPAKAGNKYGDDYLEKREFRIFLVALR